MRMVRRCGLKSRGQMGCKKLLMMNGTGAPLIAFRSNYCFQSTGWARVGVLRRGKSRLQVIRIGQSYEARVHFLAMTILWWKQNGYG